MVKTEIKLKKTKRRRKFIKDKAIVNFLLEHMKPEKIDFSKIRVPSFLSFVDNEENNSNNSKKVKENGNSLLFQITNRHPINACFEEREK